APAGRRPWPLLLAAPTLMVAVAALGTWRHVEHHQTAWRGATVGMFAHVDAPANRLVRGRATTAGGTELTLDANRVAGEVERALVTPTAGNLEAVADAWEAELVDDGHTVVGLHVEVLRT